MNTQDDDLMVIEDDEPDHSQPSESLQPFKVLIVDDDNEVHLVTRHALSDTFFLGKPLQFLSAYSAEEAKKMLITERDIALIFLDVVMETDDAGLLLIEYIRKYQNNWLVRIVLRTGQPGQAPERQVIIEYDINDYKAKTELTITRLFTTTLVSLRTYKQLYAIELSRRGLEKILDASSSLFEYRSMKEFAEGVVLQISSFIDFTHGVLLCAVSEQGRGSDLDNIYVVAGSKELKCAIGTSIGQAISDTGCKLVQKALETGQNIYADGDNAIIFKTKTQASSVVYLSGKVPLNNIDKQLLEVFCSKLAIGFDNINYYEQIQYKNTHDLLTGLFNRNAFIEKVDQINIDLREQTISNFAVSQIASAQNSNPILLVLGIDRFKDINSDLGYPTGDYFLQFIAKRLQTIMPKDSIIARLGADEFAAYIPHLQNISEDINKFKNILNQPMVISCQELIPSVSIGYEIITHLHKPCYDLLAIAEDALQNAKRVGGNRCISAHSTAQKQKPSRLTLTRELTYALKRKEFAMYYQPIINSKNGNLAGFEALLRWHHPKLGVVSPGAFLELIESTDLILPIGDWVLNETMRQIRVWNNDLNYQSLKDMSLSVNISTRQLTLSNLVEQIESFISTHDVIPNRLKLEITESLIIEDIEKAEEILHGIKAHGVKLSLDDFGTGYSSMSYLHRLPFDTLKLDKSFIQDVHRDVNANPLIRYAINLAHDLNMDVIAEGVETQQQYEGLVELGCDYLQGFLFARPLPEEKATEFILNYNYPDSFS